MKRTRRIEIVTYSRRVMLTDGEPDAPVMTDLAAAAAVAILSGTAGEMSDALSQARKRQRQRSGSEAPLARRWRFWPAWLKGK